MQDLVPDQAVVAEQAAETVEDINALVGFFNQLDAEDPLLRLITAAAVIGVSLFLLALTRLVIGRRRKHLESLPASKFRPLRLQAQDLVSSEDMQKLWSTVWRLIGLVLSLTFILTALIGVLMTAQWTLTLAARLIIFVGSILAYLWAGFVGYLPNLFTIIVIVLVVRYLVHLIGLIFDGIRTRRIHLRNFYPEWAETSFGLVKLLIYALTAVIIFPYLPGSS